MKPTGVVSWVAGFVLALLLLGGVTWLNLRGTTRAQESARWVAHTHHVRYELHNLLLALDDIESGMRGYVLAGTAGFLEPYHAGLKTVSAQLQVLPTLIVDPQQRQQFEVLKPLVARRVAHAQHIVELRSEAGFAEAQSQVALGGGKAAMDAVRAQIARMDAIENQLLLQRATVAERDAELVRAITLGGSGISVVLLVGVFALVLRESRLRERASIAAKVSEENLAVTLHSIGDAVLATDADGRITRLNLAAEQLTGWALADALGRPVADVFRIIHEETREPASIPVADTLAKGTIHGLANHTVIVARDGTERPIADSCAPIRSHDGQVIGAVLVFRDVTKEKVADAAIRASQRELEAALRANQLIMEHSLDVICTIDEQGRFAFVSAASEKVWGYTPDELVGRPYLDFVHPEDHPQTNEAAAEVLTGRLVQDFENRYVRKDGSLVPIVWSASWSAGERLMFCVARDVTERRRAEQKLDALRRRLELVYKSMPDGLHGLNLDGTINFENPAAERMLGYSPGELLGKPAHATIHHHRADGSEYPVEQCPIYATLRDRETRTVRDEVFWRKDGTSLSAEYVVSSIIDDRGQCSGAIVAFRDVSERQRAQETLRRAHDELRAAHAQLDQASRLKDEFLANMSHELRTPLNAILGLSESLLEQVGGTLTPRQEKSIATIASSGAHLLALINDILDLSKVEAGKLDVFAERIELDDFCHSCLMFVRTQAMQKDIAISFDRGDAPDAIHADPKRLKQILVNLLTNAVKFTPKGGRVGLTVSAPAGEGRVHFAVRDSGIGIAPEDQGKLFKAFSQVDSGLSRSQEGTGLGLVLVARLAELQGGSVAVESEPGRGSRFIVTLPLTASVPAGDSRTEDRRSYRKALVIEDDPSAGERLTQYLSELGVTSVLQVRGDSALEAARRECPDVILLDLQLPGESGWVALARLKDDPATSKIPVIVVSVIDDPARSLALGAVAHFTKPITRRQLAEFLQRSVEQPGTISVADPALGSSAGPVVLLAEDNEANVLTIGGYLEDKGYTLRYASNGVEAVALAHEVRPAVILMDIQMPVMDGLTAMTEIRKAAGLRSIPIVALTALAMPGDRERCIAAGATDYMTKPVSLKALAELVARLAPPPVAAVS